MKQKPVANNSLFGRITDLLVREGLFVENLGSDLAYLGSQMAPGARRAILLQVSSAAQVSTRTVERVIVILRHIDPGNLKEVLAGKISIGRAEGLVRAGRSKPKNEGTQGSQDWPSFVIQFASRPIPCGTHVRTWTSEERDLLHVFAQKALEAGLLSASDFLPVSRKLKPFAPDFGGPHNGTPPQDGSNDA